MKTQSLLILLLCSVFFSNAQISDFQVESLDKERLSVADLKGEELTIVDFWASWCKPCVSAIPKINSIYAEFLDKGVTVVGINVDGPRNQAKVRPMVKSLGVKYPILLDPDQELVSEYNVTVFPTLIVLNKKGKQVFVHEGFNPGDEKLIKEELVSLLMKK